MRSKRMLMGAAVIGCVAATMMSGAYAQGQHYRPVQCAFRPTAVDCRSTECDAPGPKRRCERACQRARQRQPYGYERPAGAAWLWQ